jgi:hypothetical protein
VIPSELGYVIATHQPASSGGAPIIVHIQEAHTNYEAQKHIVEILEQLIAQHGLKLILVEGGQGDVGLAYLRSYGPAERRRQVAEKYLKLGILSGEEYLDIASEHPLELWGVEDKPLYQKNVDAFVDAESLRASLKPALTSVREAVEALKPRLFDPSLNELEANAKAYEQRTLGLADYADVLVGLASRHGIAKDDYPQLTRFLDVRDLEQTMDRTRIQQEQGALVERLGDLVEEQALDRLLVKAQRMNADKAKRQAFYESLERLATTAQVSLDAYPSLAQYVRYVRHSAKIRPTVLAEEVGELAARLRTLLASSPRSRRLADLAQQLDLVEKLLALELSPEEYQRFASLDHASLVSSWTGFLNRQLPAQGLADRSFAGLEALETALPTLQRFYELALKRDDVLVARAMDKLEESQERLAVLITGGFHGPQITQRLKDHGVGLVVVTPKVTTATDERLYQAVLKYKSGHGTFEEVEAAAAITDQQSEW